MFKNRGVNLGYSATNGRVSTSFGVGYDRRTYYGAPGTLLAAANDQVDESFYGNVSLGAPVGARGALAVNGYASYLRQNNDLLSDALLLGASAAYTHSIFGNLSARGALSVDTIDSDAFDETNASALLGLRYDF